MRKYTLCALACAVLLASCTDRQGGEIVSDTTIATTTVDTTTAVTTETTAEATTETPTETTTTETTSETTQTEEWQRELTESEKQALLDEMPDIVFVMSEYYGDNNIYGFYVTKTGEIKMYDFRSVAPNEIFEIPDVYDRLDEATCDKIVPSKGYSDRYEENYPSSDDLGTVDIDTLVQWYHRLLYIDHDSERIDLEYGIDGAPNSTYYGVKKQGDRSHIILLSGAGNFHYYESDDDNTNQLGYEVSRCMLPVYEYEG